MRCLLCSEIGLLEGENHSLRNVLITLSIKLEGQQLLTCV